MGMLAWEQRMHGVPKPGKGVPLLTVGLAELLEQAKGWGFLQFYVLYCE